MEPLCELRSLPLAVLIQASDGIIKGMARGWESKAVEDQIAAAEAEKQTQERRVLTDLERERRAHRERLRLARAKIVSDLEASRNERYRAQLKRALADLNAELGEGEKPS